MRALVPPAWDALQAEETRMGVFLSNRADWPQSRTTAAPLPANGGAEQAAWRRLRKMVWFVLPPSSLQESCRKCHVLWKQHKGKTCEQVLERDEIRMRVLLWVCLFFTLSALQNTDAQVWLLMNSTLWKIIKAFQTFSISLLKYLFFGQSFEFFPFHAHKPPAFDECFQSSWF